VFHFTRGLALMATMLFPMMLHLSIRRDWHCNCSGVFALADYAAF